MLKHKRVLSLVMITVLLLSALSFAAAAAESDFPTVLAQTKKGVVQIYGLGSNGGRWASWVGTGFAVGQEGEDSDVFLTNWHVITCSGEFELSEVRIWILQENCEVSDRTGEPDPEKSITCEVLKTTTGYPDYAIIRATETVTGYKALPLLSSKEIQDGAKVYALGYPAVVGSASATHYGIDDITATDGIVSQHMQYALADNTWVLMHTAQISGGNSGGPLITEEGAVVGLNTYGFGENEANMNRYCAVYIDYAIDGLDELGIRYDIFGANPKDGAESTEDEPTTDETDSTEPGEGGDDEDDLILWLAIGGAGIAMTGLIAGIIISQKKKREAEAAALRRMEEHRRQEELRRRQEAERRQQEEVRRQQEEQRRREQAVKANLQMNGGAVYPVRASGGTVGREKTCMIVLPENIPGVSRVHCKLEFRGDQLVLTDLNSTYGTYIHGKRVPPNMPVALHSGSSFCLGSDKCTLTVL